MGNGSAYMERTGTSRSCPSPSRPDGYLLGSYRIATAPEPNSSRLTSFKSTCFDSPANNVGPWPASLGCTTNSYSSINPSSANACGSFTRSEEHTSELQSRLHLVCRLLLEKKKSIASRH